MSELAIIQSHALQLTEEDKATFATTYGKDLNDSELRLVLLVAQQRGLNPLNRQIHGVKRGGQLTIQTSIDGFRLIAQRSGQYAGQTPTEWCGPDGVWKEVWLADGPPAAARVGVYRSTFAHPVYGVAHFNEYAQDSGKMWKKDGMPRNMLAKCAEALALRKAFPEELSGLYSDDEMAQADAPAQQLAPVQEFTWRYEALQALTRSSFRVWWKGEGLPVEETLSASFDACDQDQQALIIATLDASLAVQQDLEAEDNQSDTNADEQSAKSEDSESVEEITDAEIVEDKADTPNEPPPFSTPTA